MTERFFTSDTHLSHNNILQYCPTTRPYSSIDEMNEDMVERWNAVVGPKDIVYHLGDVVLGGAKNLSILSRMNGKKKLVIGNHDYIRSNSHDYLKYFDSIEAYREFGRHFLIASHYPVHSSQLEDEWTKSGNARYVVNVHGHLHDKFIRDSDGSLHSRYFNVCWDVYGEPVPFSLVEDHAKQIKDML